MYLIGKDSKVIQINYGVEVKIDLSKIWNVKRTSGCKAGEYALYQKDDNDNFSIFAGYITYNTICNEFELIKWRKYSEKYNSEKYICI